MTDVRRLYLLTGILSAGGFIAEFIWAGGRNGLGFLIGAAGSFGNLWTFDLLAGAIAPGERTQKPWGAGLFVGRYIILIAAGYATVKTLNVSPLAVLLGLLASTAAALASAVFDLVESLFGKRSQ